MKFFLCLILLFTGGFARAADVHVHPVEGNDGHDGVAAPVRTIARAVALSKPGDVIHLAPATYYESLNLSGKPGLPGQPITVDGHGAVLEGSEPLDTASWEDLGNGLFRKVGLMATMPTSAISRWFFLWDGRMNRMGRQSKAAGRPLVKVADLQPDEWTYVMEENAFYIRLKEGVALANARIRYPARISGVILAGRSSHLVIKNITATHVYNDGFNIHGHQVDTVFENIRAIECGDDGFSAHETSECRVDGFVSIGNSNGICDIGSSITHYRNVYIRDSAAYDIYFVGDSAHSLENVLVESSAIHPFAVGRAVATDDAPTCQVTLKNVLIRRPSGKPGELRIGSACQFNATRCSFIGLNIHAQAQAKIHLEQSIIAGTGSEEKPAVMIADKVAWTGYENAYALSTLSVGGKSFSPTTFADFQMLTASETSSRWLSGDTLPSSCGADMSALEKLPR